MLGIRFLCWNVSPGDQQSAVAKLVHRSKCLDKIEDCDAANTIVQVDSKETALGLLKDFKDDIRESCLLNVYYRALIFVSEAYQAIVVAVMTDIASWSKLRKSYYQRMPRSTSFIAAHDREQGISPVFFTFFGHQSTEFRLGGQ